MVANPTNYSLSLDDKPFRLSLGKPLAAVFDEVLGGQDVSDLSYEPGVRGLGDPSDEGENIPVVLSMRSKLQFVDREGVAGRDSCVDALQPRTVGPMVVDGNSRRGNEL